LILTPASLFLKRAHLRQRITLLVKEVSMSRARLVASFAIMAIVIFVGGRLVTSAFPLQQPGARTPGVQTAAKLAQSEPLTFKFAAGVPVQRVLQFISQAAGLTLTTEGDLRQSLSAPVEQMELASVTVEQAFGAVLHPVGLTYRVTGPHAIVVQRAAGAVAGGVRQSVGDDVAGGGGQGVSGGVRPGVSTGTGTGPAPGVSGGVVGGVTGGVAGGVQGAPPNAASLWSETIGNSLANVVSRVSPVSTGEPGWAVVYVTVDGSGRVARVDFVSVSRRELMELATEAARQWVFEPSPLPERATAIAFNLGVASAASATDSVRIGGNVPPPLKTQDVKPVYPKEASEAGIQGVQILEISVDPSGTVLDARVLRGQRLLVGAAIHAVLQWKFSEWPGPERRLMTVTVNFTLDNAPLQGSATPARDVTTWKAPEPSGTPLQYGSAADWPPEAIRVGGSIKPPNKTVDVRAVYPDVAQKARVQGVVICELLVGPDGRVADARVVRSIPMLDQAALDAVREWEFTPTLLNGTPVPVIMTVTVNFTLQ
jgi:TonB family protein